MAVLFLRMAVLFPRMAVLFPRATAVHRAVDVMRRQIRLWFQRPECRLPQLRATALPQAVTLSPVLDPPSRQKQRSGKRQGIGILVAVDPLSSHLVPSEPVELQHRHSSNQSEIPGSPSDFELRGQFHKIWFPGNARLRKADALTHAIKTPRSSSSARQRISKRGGLRQAWEPMCFTFHNLFMVETRKNYHAQPRSRWLKLQLTDFSKVKTMRQTRFPFPQFGLTRLG